MASCVAIEDVPINHAVTPPPKLHEEYLQAARSVIDEQLQRAGVRLANVLNEALR
jgi:hypothetical protein